MGDKLYQSFIDNSKLSRIALFNILENPKSSWIDDVSTPDTETFAGIVQLAYSDAINYLTKKYSGDINKWEWGKIHTITFKHPATNNHKILDFLFNMNRGPFGVSGSYHTVCPYSYPANEPSNVVHGASHRHIYSVADWDSTQSVIPTGNSGVIKSRFYLDQTELYIAGKYHHDYFSDKAVKSDATYTMVLKPE